MLVVNTKSALSAALGSGDDRGEICFVPTMGALHAGHLSLVKAAKQTGGTVVVSIFVNPTQFNDPADLANYPQTLELDLLLLAREGVDIVFVPEAEEMYPTPDTRTWDFGELDAIMEGASRPGHFNGVAQIVSKLFEAVKPDKAFFGEKDFQQIAVITEMTKQAKQNNEPWARSLEIIPCPIVREPDGLAMSSRNSLLPPEYRAAAPAIYSALKSHTDPAQITRQIETSDLLKVIYCEPHWGRTFVAVQAGPVRLIDNYDNRDS